jgi:16S rRNA (guanine1207-N2)-methyltransferase
LSNTAREAVYGSPDPELADSSAAAIQTSPLIPGSTPLEDLPDAGLGRFVLAAPPATLERRYALAQALRALSPGGELIAMAPKDRGGQRLKAELESFGCTAENEGRRHQRVARATRPANPAGLDEAIADGALREAGPGVWTQPGVFSWDRLDPGSERLLPHLDGLSGEGADLGCGLGVLSRRALRSPAVTALTLIDIDRRATDAARRNIDDPRVTILHANVRTTPLEGLDFVIMNPPFHAGGSEDRSLGQTFIRKAAAALHRGGKLYMVANVDLPYEALLAELFARVTPLEKGGGFKLFVTLK